MNLILGRIINSILNLKNHPERKEIKLADALEKYIIHLNTEGYSNNTIYCYSRDFRILLNLKGNIYMHTITEETIKSILTHLRQPGLKQSVHTISTNNRIKIAFRSFFHWCYDSGYLGKNYISSFRLVNNRSKHTVPITQDQITQLFDTMSEFKDYLSKRDKVLFAVYIFSGIRKSEALSLRINDYNRSLNTLYLRKAKNAANRFQTIPSILTDILNKYVVDNFNTSNTCPLFPGQSKNTSLSGRQASNRFNVWKRLSGIGNDLTIHSFRSAYAVQLYKISLDPLLVSYALGHRSFSSTKGYISDDIFDMKNVLEKAFNASKSCSNN